MGQITIPAKNRYGYFYRKKKDKEMFYKYIAFTRWIYRNYDTIQLSFNHHSGKNRK